MIHENEELKNKEEKARYRLIASDIDGTLLNSKSQLTDRTRQAILAAEKKGVLFSASSGRPLRALGWLADAVESDAPFITFNGAVVITAKTGKVLLRQGVKTEYAKDVCLAAKERGLETVIWTDNDLYATGITDKIAEYRGISDAVINEISSIDELDSLSVAKLLWITDADKAAVFQAEMGKHFEGKLNVHTSRPTFLEFVDVNASKALAMEAIGKQYGIERGEMIAVGDGWNDLTMLQYAGLGVAMGNAPDEIKKQCAFVAPSNDEDGVAYIIEKFCLS